LLRRRLGCEQLEDRRLLATIQVTSLDDTIDLTDGMTTLREALFAASVVMEDAEIVFDPALFTNGARSIPLKLGTLTISDSVTITGPGADLLTLDASWSDPTPDVNQGDGISAVTIINGGNALVDVTLRGLTIRRGDAQEGGGIFSRGNLALDQCIVRDNYATSHGGGINFVAGRLEIRDSVLRNNRSDAIGGGVYSFNGNVKISGSLFESNYAGRAGGGASGHSGDLNVTRSVFRDNYSSRGGGLDWGAETTVIRDSSFIENRAAIQGGGLSIIAGNSTTASLEISGSSFIGNRTEVAGAHGGGLFITSGAAPTIRLEQLTVSGNMAAGDGGGMAIVTAGTPEVRLSTFTGNSAAGSGGGIHSRNGALELSHVIVAGNEAGTALGADLRIEAPGTVMAAHSIVGTNSGTALIEAPLGSPDANGNLIGGPVGGVIDALLGPLADNGGPALPGGFRVLTHKPLAGSPVIDAGDAALEPGVGDTPNFDQRGAPFSRVVGARIDIGAVEAIGAPIVVDTLVDASDGKLSKGDLSLREAIELSNAQPGAETIVFDPSLFASGPGSILLTQGELVITGTMTITGPGASLLTIDASGNDPTPGEDKGDGSRVIRIDDTLSTASTVVISGVGLEGGDVLGHGGAISAKEALTLDRVDIRGNSATELGGGSGPNAIDNGLAGAVLSTWSLTLRDSRISGNTGGRGGGIYATGSLNIERSEIRDNYSRGNLGGVGGGISGRNAMITIADSSLVGNSARVGTGGLRAEGGQVTITRSVIADNSGSLGGGIGVRMGKLILSSSTVSGNSTTTEGGGIWLLGVGGDIADSTISGNAANGSGGGISLESSARLSATRMTLTNNRADADAAGAIGVGGGVSGLTPLSSVTHSIVAGNFVGGGSTPSDVSDRFGREALGDVFRYSLIGYNTHPTIAEAPLGSPDTKGNLVGGPVHGVIDAKLGPLVDNGGPALPGGAKLLTRAPLAGSPVIDAGDPALVPGVGGVPEFDQRGAPYSRLTASRIDMGAVELQATGGALSGDFDLDGHVNGIDFLVWQRGLGRSGIVTIRHGDATADGNVDANDLEVWKARAAEGAERIRGQESGVSPRGGKSQAALVADAVFAAGDFSALFTANESPSAVRGKWRPMRRV
jgi:hypothetical protein